MNEQLLRQVLMFYSLGKKKIKKSVVVGGGGGAGGRVASNRRWVPVFCFTQLGGAFPCLNFSKLCGTSPLIRFFYPSIAIRYTKSTDLITEESIALIATNRVLHSILSKELFWAPYILHVNVSKFVPDLINLRCSKFISNSTLTLSKLLRAWMN